MSAYTNLGYLSLKLGKRKEALMYYNYALTLDPGHEKTLVNKAQLLLLDNNKKAKGLGPKSCFPPGNYQGEYVFRAQTVKRINPVN